MPDLTYDAMRPVMSLLLVQLLAGAWTLSLMSFFPIYLEEQLRYAPVAIAGMVAVGQASGMAGGAARWRVERHAGQQMGVGVRIAGRRSRQLDLPVRRATDGGCAVGTGRRSGQPANARWVELPHADGRSATAGSPGGALRAQRHPGRRARQPGGRPDSGYRRVSRLRVGRIGSRRPHGAAGRDPVAQSTAAGSTTRRQARPKTACGP